MKSIIVLLFLTASAFSIDTMAHESRPLYIEIQEMGDQRVSVKWKAPRSLAFVAMPLPFISGCGPAQALALSTVTDGHLGQYLSHCDNGVGNRTLNTGYKSSNPSLSTIVTVIYADESENTKVLGPVDTEWKIPVQATFISTLQS